MRTLGLALALVLALVVGVSAQTLPFYPPYAYHLDGTITQYYEKTIRVQLPSDSRLYLWNLVPCDQGLCDLVGTGTIMIDGTYEIRLPHVYITGSKIMGDSYDYPYQGTAVMTGVFHEKRVNITVTQTSPEGYDVFKMTGTRYNNP